MVLFMWILANAEVVLLTNRSHKDGKFFQYAQKVRPIKCPLEGWERLYKSVLGQS